MGRVLQSWGNKEANPYCPDDNYNNYNSPPHSIIWEIDIETDATNGIGGTIEWVEFRQFGFAFNNAKPIQVVARLDPSHVVKEFKHVVSAHIFWTGVNQGYFITTDWEPGGWKLRAYGFGCPHSVMKPCEHGYKNDNYRCMHYSDCKFCGGHFEWDSSD